MSGTPRTGRWDDLALRLGSGAALVGLGMGAVWLGGLWFHALIAVVCGLMVWELVCMLDTGRRRSQYVLAGVTAVSALAAMELPVPFALPLLLLPSMLGLARMERGGVPYAVFTALILAAGYGMTGLRDDLGLFWMLWLVLVVVATDVAGYFGGRSLGGPKLWPRLSPKKTWSGAAVGWLAAAAVGLAFAKLTQAGVGLAGVSVAVSMASQLGDIAESALKRRCGTKDSSALIPGHGGLLDRFDGMLGAALFVMVVGQATEFPPV